MLRDHGVAFTLVDHPWMYRIDHLMEKVDPVTAEFVFVRWLGDRRKIEEMTDTWDRLVINRTEDLLGWVPVFQDVLERKVHVLAYFNNHYAGHAPASVRMLQDMLAKVGENKGGKRLPVHHLVASLPSIAFARADSLAASSSFS
ncbi:MAG: DUF72 domain-containing protein [Nitrospinota bacterium]